MIWIKLATTIASLLPRLISMIDTLRNEPGQGAAKRVIVRDIILTTIEGIEGATGRDIFNDAEVMKAYNAANDAIVALQNAITKKAAAMKN